MFYEVTATTVEESDISIQRNFELNEAIDFEVDPQFTYNVQINANYIKDSTTHTLYTGMLTNINPNTQKTAISLTLTPSYNSETKGSLNLPIKSLLSGAHIKVDFINTYSEGASESITGTSSIDPISITPINSSYTISKTDITPGTYGMNIYFYEDNYEDSLILMFPTLFTIYPLMATNEWENDTFFLNSGEFTLNEQIITALESSVIYVRGEDATNFPEGAQVGNDENAGTVFAPLATLAKAISLCTSGSKTIYVDGMIEQSERVTFEDDVTVYIKALSLNPDEKPIIKRIGTENGESLFRTTYSGNIITFENIVFDGNGENVKGDESGACIYNKDGQLELTDCVVKNFTAEPSTPTSVDGGAIYIENSGNIEATDCVFENNKVVSTNGRGGAVYLNCNGGRQSDFSKCQFVKNGAFEMTTDGPQDGARGSGGALYTSKANLNISECVFRENSCSYFGGALFVVGSGTVGSAQISETKFLNNITISTTQETRAGALFLQCNTTVRNCKFAGNSVTANSTKDAKGGAIWLQAYNINFDNCIIGKFTDTDGITYGPNHAKDGGAVWSYGGISYGQKNTTSFDNCIIGDATRVNNNFSGNQTQVQLSDCAAIDNYGNWSNGSVFYADGERHIRFPNTKFCYNYSGDSIIYSTGDHEVTINSTTNIYGNTTGSDTSDFAAIIKNESTTYVYGKIHHNYINGKGGVIHNAKNFNIYDGAEICYNNQNEPGTFTKLVNGTDVIMNLNGSICNISCIAKVYSGYEDANVNIYGGTIKGNYSKHTPGKEVYEMCHIGKNFNIYADTVIGTVGDTNPYNSIYLAKDGDTQKSINIYGSLSNGFVAKLVVPEYTEGLQILTGSYVDSCYNKFLLENSTTPDNLWEITSEGKITEVIE